MPPHTLFRARLLFQLTEQCLQRHQILVLREELLPTKHKLTRADVVEVIVLKLVVLDVAISLNHLFAVFLEILTNGLVLISEIGVEHTFHLDSHHIAPLRFLGKVEHVRVAHASHFRMRHPFAIVSVRNLVEHHLAVHVELVEMQVTNLTRSINRLLLHTVPSAVVHMDVIHILH